MGEPGDEYQNPIVASRAEAWIETININIKVIPFHVASRAEAWIETRRITRLSEATIGRLPRGGVD